VDTKAGFIVACDVIAMTDEHRSLISQIQHVQTDFNLPSPPAETLGDGAMSSGSNLKELERLGGDLVFSGKNAGPSRESGPPG